MQRDGNLSECSAVSALTKHWSISTQWKVAKKIMESERVFFFLCVCLCLFYSMHLGGWLAFVSRKNDKGGTLLTDTADFTFLHDFKCSVTSKEHFYLSLKCAKENHCSSVGLKIIRLENTFSKIELCQNREPGLAWASEPLNYNHSFQRDFYTGWHSNYSGKMFIVLSFSNIKKKVK